MNEPQLIMTVDALNQPPVVTAVGDIDLANVDQFEESLMRAAADAPAITVDISQVRYCDSTAIRALFAVAATTALTLIVSNTGPIRTALNVLGLDRTVTVKVAE